MIRWGGVFWDRKISIKKEVNIPLLDNANIKCNELIKTQRKKLFLVVVFSFQKTKQINYETIWAACRNPFQIIQMSYFIIVLVVRCMETLHKKMEKRMQSVWKCFKGTRKHECTLHSTFVCRFDIKIKKSSQCKRFYL